MITLIGPADLLPTSHWAWRTLALAILYLAGIEASHMSDGKDSPRHWRVIAQELANETDPVKAQSLIEELTRAIRFTRYVDGNEPLREKPI